MGMEGLRAYLELASGLTDVTRQRATAAARALVAQGEAGVESVVGAPVRAHVSVLAEELLATSKGNRDLLVNLVRGEVERSVTRLGLVSAAEVESANSRAQQLETRVHQLERELRTARKSPKTAQAGTRATKANAPSTTKPRKSKATTLTKSSTPRTAKKNAPTTTTASAAKTTRSSARGARKT